MAVGKGPWSLEDLVDFEVAMHQGPKVDAEVGREVRTELREGRFGDDPVSQRRSGLKHWLKSETRSGIGRRVVGVTKLMGAGVLLMTFLAGIGVVRGLVSDFSYVVEGQDVSGRGFNIWVLLATTLGIQWLLLLGGLLGFVLVRRWSGGLGWIREGIAALLRKFSGQVDSVAWDSLLRTKERQRSALVWRLGRIAQLGGIGFNLGLLAGLFGMLWFTKVVFYWESSLAQFGVESLERTVGILSFGVEGVDPGRSMVEECWLEISGWGTNSGLAVWNTFFFFALLVWGLFPRLVLYVLMIWKERKALRLVDFQDPEHREIWRELSRVERAVTIEGPSDGVVLLDVGGGSYELEKLRPFMLQELRVNPEKLYSVGVLDAGDEREAWEAMRKAPCGVVLLVEAWDLSPKQMTALFERVRREAGEETVLRVLVVGDGMVEPGEEEFEGWQKFIDGVRDPLLECVAFRPGKEA